MFVIVENNSVVLGPNDWNRRRFQSFISEELEIQYDLPQTINSALQITDSVKIYPVQFDPVPECNPRTEILHGPFWTFVNDIAVASYTIMNKSIEAVKNDMLGELANKRWKKETEGVILDVQNNTVKITTERGTRDIFLQAMQLGKDGNVWKFDKVDTTADNRVIGAVWITLSISELQQIVSAITTKVQDAFDWEGTIAQQINNATTLTELANIEL